MSTATTAFLSRLIDYAGLFPPASLELLTALANYRVYRDLPDAWMLGRFIVPATRLAETGTIAGEWFFPEDPWDFSVLGQGGADWKSFSAGVSADLAEMTTFCKRYGEAVRLQVYETRLPSKSWEALGAIIGETLDAIDVLGGITPFLEAGPPPHDTEYWKRTTLAIVDELGNDNCTRFTPAGFKLRCGGTTPDLFPTPDQVAWVIGLCHDRRVPLKATAGLHHPIRHFNQELQTTMHGFLNVFGAGILAVTHALDRATLTEIIADEDPIHFHFDGDTFRWRDLTADSEAIAHARQVGVLSYGSCSFDEPREDLRAIGVLA